jgi:hypothetical protein
LPVRTVIDKLLALEKEATLHNSPGTEVELAWREPIGAICRFTRLWSLPLQAARPFIGASNLIVAHKVV